MRRALAKIRGFLSWVLGKPKKVTIPVALIVFGAGFFFAFKMADAYDYVQNDPRFCRSCHIMEKAWDRWLTSEHRSLTCHQCHEASVVDNTRLLWTYAFTRREQVDRHAVVQDEACEKCHESGNPRWRQVALTAGHSVHAEEQGIACVKCHALTTHRFTPPGTICQTCHEGQRIMVSGMATTHCISCHNFLKEDTASLLTKEGHPLLPTREPCLSCHRAQGRPDITWPVGAAMQFPCLQCHQPHKQAEPTVNCQSCHPAALSQGLHAKESHVASKCQTCHQPHQWKVAGRETCLACHPAKANHNLGTECALCHGFKQSPVALGTR